MPLRPRIASLARWRPGRRFAIALAALLLVLVALQLLASPIALRLTRQRLAELEGYRGVVADVHASIIPPRFEARDVKIIELPHGDWHQPLLYVERVQGRVLWRALLHGIFVADARITGPKLSLVRRVKSDEPVDLGKLVPDLTEKVERKAPIRVDRITLSNAEVLVSDATQTPPARLWLHGVDGELENLATRRWLAHGHPTRAHVEGRLQRSGRFKADLSADPWEKTLTFDGRTSVEHLSARDLGELMHATTGMKPEGGSLDLYADFKARDGTLKGGVKVRAKDLHLVAANPGFVDKLKAWLSNAAIEVFSSKKPGEPEVFATVIPIRGSVDTPDAELWPTVLGVVRNAFVQGVGAGFRGVPPPTAPKKENALEQAGKALNPKAGPVEAQPQARRKHKDSKSH